MDKLEKKPNPLLDFVSKRLILSLAFIAIFLLGIGYLVVIKPAWDYLSDTNIKSVEAQVRLDEATIKLAKLIAKANDKQLIISQEDNSLLSLVLPSRLDFSSIMIQLNNMAKSQDFKVKKIEINEYRDRSGDTGNLKKAIVQMEIFGGSYEKFKNFILAMENSILPFNILSINAGAQTAQQNYQISFLTYYFTK